MRKGVVLLAAVFIILGLYSLPAYAEVITLDQAKAQASANSRSLSQYQLNTEKAKYQIDKAEMQQAENVNLFYSLFSQYQAIQEQIAVLQEAEGDNSQAISELRQQLQELDDRMDSQLESNSSSSDSVANSEESYEDSKVAEASYAKQLDYEIEKLYISILTQQNSLETMQLESQIAELELQMEKTRLQMGVSTQTQVYEKSKSLTALQQNIAAAGQNIRAAEGTLNDIMGRDYDAELELVAFNWTSTVEVPDYSTLLTKTAVRNQTLKQAERAIEDAEDELDDSDDFYDRMVLTVEIEEKKLQLQDEKLKLSQSVENLINEITSRQEAYETAQLNCQNAQQQYTWDQKRFELGQISELTLLNSEISYLNAKNQQASESYALFLAEQSLQLAEKGII